MSFAYSGLIDEKVKLVSYPLYFYFGPSGVRALPLVAGTNEGGHYFRYIFPLLVLILLIFLLPPLFKTTEGVVVLFQIFAWAPN